MEKFKKILYIKWFFYIFFIDLFVLKAENNPSNIIAHEQNKMFEFKKNFDDSIENHIDNGEIIKLENLISFTKITESDFKKYLLLSKNNILKKRENLNKKLTVIEATQLIGGVISIFLASIGISSFCWLSWSYFIEDDYKNNKVVENAIYGLPPSVLILGLFGDRLLTKFLYKRNREKQYNNALGIDYILYSKFQEKFKLKSELNEEQK